MKMSKPDPFVDAAQGAASQIAALCWRMHKGRVQILLITSRDTGRWVIPKGWPMAGRSSASAAAREAWEEAGVEGKVHDTPLGTFTYDKLDRTDATLQCAVDVHPLKVLALKARFPESHQRRRAWFQVDLAAVLVAEPQLKDLLRRVEADPGLLRSPA